MVKFFKKHWEVLSYLIFGVLTTLLNIVLYALFNKLFGYTAANSWGNVLDNILCILFAYATNRAFVFRSRTQGREMAKEFGAFVTCRLGTLVLDAVIMMVGGNLLAAQGTALMEGLMQGVLGAVAGWISGKHDQHLRRRRGSFCCHRHHRWCRWPDGDLRQRLQRTDFVGLMRQGLFQRDRGGVELCVQQTHHL